MPAQPVLITPGQIASRVGAPLHRVLHVLNTRCIPPVARAGTIRVYDTATVERVRAELNAITARRLLRGLSARPRGSARGSG